MTGMVQLKVRTEFSFKQCFGPLPRVAAALQALGCPAAAIVDPGTWGHVKWGKELGRTTVAPLFGAELTVAQPDGRKPTAWAIAEEPAALYRLTTAALRPDADVAALFREARGVIRFAGAALTDPDTFDYIDLNPASPLQQRAALRLHAATGKPLVVTSDNAYSTPSDYAAFMAIIDRSRTTPQHLLSVDELRAELRVLTAAQFDAAVSNCFDVAARAARELPTAPLIRVPGDIRALAEAGKQRRLSLGHLPAWPAEYEARLQRELAMIEMKDYVSYFLVVADLVTWAKQRMLVGPGRGSSAGSLLCYLVGITEVDPIPHDLLFERFVDVTRKDLPDIDIDFSDVRREQCFAYLSDKYGAENVARMGNINTFKPRSVLLNVCRRFAIHDKERFDLVNVLIEYSSGDSRYGKGLEDTLQSTDIGRAFMAKHPKAAIMGEVENHASHSGVHAAGVIVCNAPISNYCTVTPEGIAQIDKPDAEALNLLKIDALGLRTLGVIEDAGVVTSEELYALKLDDPEVLSIFNQRRFSAIFQFEGQAQRSVAANVDFDSFRKIDHVTALARPGPLGGGASNHYILRAAGQEAVAYQHESMRPYLEQTYGVVLYQEQVMSIVREIGKFSWEDTTVIRKAMSGRKGKEFFDQKGEQFIRGAAEDGIDAQMAHVIWNEICSFGAWGMNRCLRDDTPVRLAHPNQFLGTNPTMRQLHDFYKCAPSAWVRQRKLMPVLLCAGPDGVARPTMAADIHYNGAKECVRLEFSDGSFVDCTEDHRFIIDGAWRACSDAAVGDEFSAVAREYGGPPTANPDQGWTRGLHWIDGRRPRKNGASIALQAFKSARAGAPCEDCGQPAHGRMEAHHNDMASGKKRPLDLAWLCNGCHKQRHIDNGTRRAPFAKGHLPIAPKVLVDITALGAHPTYDIEMPAPNHNFVLGNGLLTHNSHTVSYAVISYWCAWLKRYHPLAYAAACVRNAKDDDHALAVLREMAEEGVRYVPFDIDRSLANWAVIDGELVGGFMNLVGIGPSKAAGALAARAAGKLDREKWLAKEVKFKDLYPLNTAYAALYADPEAHGCQVGSRIIRGPEMPEAGEVLYLGLVVEKERRDENETVRVARRDGRLLRAPTAFLDLKVRDDSGIPFTVRIDRFNFEPLGRLAAENLVAGKDVVLVRGQRIPGFQMIKARRMKCLTNPEALQ